MTNELLQNVIINATWIVLLLRLVNGISHRQRSHVIWTFSLSLLAWLILFLRLSVTRNFHELISVYDPASTVAWLGVLVTQAIATLYEWLPEPLLRRLKVGRSS